MANEIVVGSHVLSGAEVLIATLTTWHPFVDVYVDANADPALIGSLWTVYAISNGTKTRIATGKFTGKANEGQRVISGAQGLGTTIALYASSPNGASAVALQAAIVGWDPGTATTNPSDAVAYAGSLSGAEVLCGALVWHPALTVFVQAPAQAKGSVWRIKAVIGMGFSEIPIAQGTFLDVQSSRVVVQAQGGATSWKFYASAPSGPTGAVVASMFGAAPPGAPLPAPIQGLGVAAPITSTGGANPVIGILAASGGTSGSMSAADKTKLNALGTVNPGVEWAIPIPITDITADAHLQPWSEVGPSVIIPAMEAGSAAQVWQSVHFLPANAPLDAELLIVAKNGTDAAIWRLSRSFYNGALMGADPGAVAPQAGDFTAGAAAWTLHVTVLEFESLPVIQAVGAATMAIDTTWGVVCQGLPLT
jgi:hypothetical protein